MRQQFILRLFTLVGLIGAAFLGAVVAQTETGSDKSGDRPLVIVRKAKANYTDEAREKNVQGIVNLKVTFKSDATVGAVVWIDSDSSEKKDLETFGLIDSAIRAAKKIKFEPEIKDGKAVTVERVQSYQFTIY